MRVLAAVLFAASTLLAGCVSVPEAPAAGVTPSTDLLPSGTEGVFHGVDGASALAPPGEARAAGGQYSLGVDATEPTLGVDAEGVVYMTGFAKGGLRGSSTPTIMRSVDKGQTWEDAGPTLPTGHGSHQGTFDPYVLVDRATGRVFMDDIWPLSCGSLSFSDDQGATWTTNPASCGNPQVNDHQTVGVGKPRVTTTVGYPNIVYRCTNNVAYTGCAMSHNGGLTFTPQVPVVSNVKDCGAITGHLASDPEGRVFLGTGTCGSGVPGVAITEDDGLTWKLGIIDPESEVEAGEHDVEIASDEAGNLYAVWTSDGHIRLSRSTDHGATWTPSVDVTAPGVTATMFATVAAAGPGKIAFAYIGSTIEGGYEGKPTGIGGLLGDLLGEPDPEEWHAATWNAYIGVVTDALADELVVQTVTANDPADPIARGLCGRTRCHGMNDFIDIEIDAEGRPWAAFVDVCTQECVTDPEVRWDQSVGFVGTLVRGPALAAAGGELPVLAPPPVAASEETEA